MIDTNKKFMLLIVDANGNMDDNYFEDRPDNVHYKIFRDYINNKSIDFSLKYDLKQADKKSREQGLGIETRLYELMKIFLKNGYMLLQDNTDYRQYADSKKHVGYMAIPTDMDHLSDIHKQVLNQLSNEIIIDKVCEYKNMDKIVYFELPVFCYNKETKEMNSIADFNEVIYELNNQFKHVK